MDPLHYSLALIACLAVTLPLEWLGNGVYRRPRRLVAAVLPPAAVFLVWDLLAVWRGHWSYDGEQLLGITRTAVLPLEEVAFFVVIPVCALLTYEAVRGILRRSSGAMGREVRVERHAERVQSGA